MVSRPCSALVYHPYFHWAVSQLSVVVALALAVFVFVYLASCCPSAVCLLYLAVDLLCLLVGLQPEHYNSQIQQVVFTGRFLKGKQDFSFRFKKKIIFYISFLFIIIIYFIFFWGGGEVKTFLMHLFEDYNILSISFIL